MFLLLLLLCMCVLLAPALVKGHAGQLLFGMLNGKCVVCMLGRVHAYEGHSMWQVSDGRGKRGGARQLNDAKFKDVGGVSGGGWRVSSLIVTRGTK